MNPPNPTVLFEGLRIDDLDTASVTSQCRQALSHGTRFSVAALHVSSLVERHSAGFSDSLQRFDVVHADGYSVAIAARLAGAKRAQRLTTTDLVNDLLVTSSGLRLALVGGEPGVAEEAALNLGKQFDAEVVIAAHGYHDDWSELLTSTRSAAPDVLLVGLGMPLEARWVDTHFDQLPDCLVITCGGLLRLLAEREQRAPKFLRRARLEWFYRLTTDPRRTWHRYSRGFAVCAGLYGRLLWKRVGRGRRD